MCEGRETQDSRLHVSAAPGRLNLGSWNLPVRTSPCLAVRIDKQPRPSASEEKLWMATELGVERTSLLTTSGQKGFQKPTEATWRSLQLCHSAQPPRRPLHPAWPSRRFLNQPLQRHEEKVRRNGLALLACSQAIWGMVFCVCFWGQSSNRPQATESG